MTSRLSFPLYPLNSRDLLQQSYAHTFLCISCLCLFSIVLPTCCATENQLYHNSPRQLIQNFQHLQNTPFAKERIINARKVIASALSAPSLKASAESAAESVRAAAVAFGMSNTLSVHVSNTSLHSSEQSGQLNNSLSGGHLALEEARRAAGLQPPAALVSPGNSPHAIPTGPQSPPSTIENLILDSPVSPGDVAPRISPGGSAHVSTQNHHAPVFPLHRHDDPHIHTDSQENTQPISCDSAVCINLRDRFLDAVESNACRTIFDNGKCPTLCSTSLSLITGNQSWSPCVRACPDDDVVMGSVSRWVRLCDARTESFIDQGKEAVKSFVSEGFVSRLQLRVILQFIIAVLILFLGVSYGYRRGSISAQMTHYARQKRRRTARKHSDANLPL